MIKSIKNIDITDKFYKDYLNLLNSFRSSNIEYKTFINIINNLPINHDIFIYFDNDNDIIGTITVILEQKIINNGGIVCHIEDFIISEKYKKLGYGSSILEFIKNYSKNKNCYKIILDCNPLISSFYIKNNFQNLNTQMCFYIT